MYIAFAIINYFYFENTSYGWGLFFPNSTPFYHRRVSPMGVFYGLIGVCGLASYSTVLPGVCLMATGVVYSVAARK
jgi:hypothetical protein